MRALHYDPAPDPPRVWLAEAPEPVPGPGEVLVAVRATALNRADLLQVRGGYPPPPGESAIPGLECAGEVLALGEGADRWRPGQRVMALLAGGGHAERVAVPSGQLLPLPEGLSFEEGAAVPEAGVTAWTNLVTEGALREGETVLLAGAASGVGTFAVQLARELGARVLVAGRSRERLEALLPLGAFAALPLDDGLPRAAAEATGGAGVDLALDLVGGPGVAHRLETLRPGGRLVLLGLLAGGRATIDLAALLRRRLRLTGSVLRSRPRREKAALVAAFGDFALPRLAERRLRPVIDRVLPFGEIARAYRELEAGGVLGKIVLTL